METLRPALSALLSALESLPLWVVIAAAAVALLAAALAACLTAISVAQGRILRAQSATVRAYRAKLGKIPVLVMSLRDHLYVPDEVFKVVVGLYADAVMREFEDPYALLESSGRIQHEIQFIMTVANKHHKVNLDGNFLYVRDFLIQYETELKAAVRELAAATNRRNRVYRWKNLLVLGLALPPYSALPEIAT